jgi:hypothetical protein
MWVEGSVAGAAHIYRQPWQVQERTAIGRVARRGQGRLGTKFRDFLSGVAFGLRMTRAVVASTGASRSISKTIEAECIQTVTGEGVCQHDK